MRYFLCLQRKPQNTKITPQSPLHNKVPRSRWWLLCLQRWLLGQEDVTTSAVLPLSARASPSMGGVFWYWPHADIRLHTVVYGLSLMLLLYSHVLSVTHSNSSLHSVRLLCAKLLSACALNKILEAYVRALPDWEDWARNHVQQPGRHRHSKATYSPACHNSIDLDWLPHGRG